MNINREEKKDIGRDLKSGVLPEWLNGVDPEKIPYQAFRKVWFPGENKGGVGGTSKERR